MKHRILYKVTVFVIISSLCFGCAVNKRHYRKGYSVSWAPRKHDVEKSACTLHTKEKMAQKRNQTEAGSPIELSNVSSRNSVFEKNCEAGFRILKPRTKALINDSCGDLIVFRDGTEQTVKIVEVLEGTIRYLPCNNLKGPVRVSNSENVFMITYASGLKEVFKQEVKAVKPVPAGQPKIVRKLNGFALASFICAMFGILILPGVLALIFGSIALNQMKKDPAKYKGKWMAITGVSIGAIASSFLALLVIVNL